MEGVPRCCAAQVGALKRQLAEASHADSGDLQRRLKEVTDLLYLKQVGWLSGWVAGRGGAWRIRALPYVRMQRGHRVGVQQAGATGS